jgi:hypothetical protein
MRWFVVLFALLMAVPAQAFEFGEEGEDMSFYGMPLPAAKPGNLAWQTIGSTKETESIFKHPELGEIYVTSPTFGKNMKSLDGKIVTISGFMFPLEQTESQANFLFGPFPPSCPYHYDLPLSLIVEVKAKAPVEFSWDEISLRGTLVLAEKDPNGIFYFLQNAEIITN